MGWKLAPMRIITIITAATALVLGAACPPLAAAPAPALNSAASHHVACDFNGDGYADLAIGSPDESVGSKSGAGVVDIILGSAAGPTSVANQHWHQDRAGVRGVARQGDQFGWSLVCGDFNSNGYADLAIGIWLERFAGKKAGAVQVLYGSGAGLTASGNQLWHQGSAGVPGKNQQRDRFGQVLAVGDFDGDGTDDLAIGVPEERIRGIRDAGRVVVLRGSGSGLVAAGAQSWSQDSQGVADEPEVEDSFGSGLAAGDFNADGRADLAITALGEAVTSGGGAVHILSGGPAGLSATGSQFLTADQLGFPQSQLRWVRGLQSLAAADFNADGRSDLAIGYPNSSELTVGGAAATLYGHTDGFHPAEAQLWHLDRADLPGQSLENDRFGQTFATGDLTGDGVADLAIGAPLRVVNGRSQAGAVYMLAGSPAGLGATSLELNQDTAGLPGSVQDWDDFSESMTALALSGGPGIWLGIGAPGDDIGTGQGGGSVTLIPVSPAGLVAGASQIWHQDTPGIRGRSPGARFGASLGAW